MTANRLIDRSPNGLSDASEMGAMGDIAMLNPFRYHFYEDDFDTYIPANWTLTETAAGSTELTIDGDGGLLSIINVSAGATDEASIQWAGGSAATRLMWFWDATKDMILKSKFQVDLVATTAILVGLASVDTTPVASLPAQGIFFSKPAGAALVGTIRIGGVSTSIALGNMVDATMIDVAMVYTAIDGLWRGFVNDVCVGSAVGAANTPILGLTQTIGLLNASGAAHALTLDQYLVAKQRF